MTSFGGRVLLTSRNQNVFVLAHLFVRHQVYHCDLEIPKLTPQARPMSNRIQNLSVFADLSVRHGTGATLSHAKVRPEQS